MNFSPLHASVRHTNNRHLNNRREFLGQVAIGAMGTSLALNAAVGFAHQPAELNLPTELIIDTHQHLWSMQQMTPPWLSEANDVLKHEYGVAQYRQAIGKLNMRAIYMEVDVAPADHVAEAKQIVELIDQPQSMTQAAVIGGRPSDNGFGGYLDTAASSPHVKGVRQVLHGEQTPPGYCLQGDFIRGIRELGKRGLMYDICIRPTELMDAAELVRRVPETYFILDHCGNADVNAFRHDNPTPTHDADQWRRGIEALAALPNVSCKISGIVARAEQGWQPEDLKQVVNHCLAAFGPERVVFGSDWPVCLLGSPLQPWVSALHEIIQTKPAEHQSMLWSENAKRIYKLV